MARRPEGNGRQHWTAVAGGDVRPSEAGMVGGIGLDLVEIERLTIALKRTTGFAERVFTSNEREQANRQHSVARHLAGCFAGKEAFLKAVGVGLWDGPPLQQVEVIHSIGGPPRLELGPLALDAVRRLGCRSTVLALSHQATMAVAVVVVQ